MSDDKTYLVPVVVAGGADEEDPRLAPRHRLPAGGGSTAWRPTRALPVSTIATLDRGSHRIPTTYRSPSVSAWAWPRRTTSARRGGHRHAHNLIATPRNPGRGTRPPAGPSEQAAIAITDGGPASTRLSDSEEPLPLASRGRRRISSGRSDGARLDAPLGRPFDGQPACAEELLGQHSARSCTGRHAKSPNSTGRPAIGSAASFH